MVQILQSAALCLVKQNKQKNHVSETIHDSLSTIDGATQFPLQKKDVLCFFFFFFDHTVILKFRTWHLVFGH